MICSAQEESPQGRKFIEGESCKKILYCKIEKNKFKRCQEGHQIIENFTASQEETPSTARATEKNNEFLVWLNII
jgi:hypothetical protein